MKGVNPGAIKWSSKFQVRRVGIYKANRSGAMRHERLRDMLSEEIAKQFSRFLSDTECPFCGLGDSRYPLQYNSIDNYFYCEQCHLKVMVEVSCLPR